MRKINEIDDIFVLIAFMDERNLLIGLPVYVADNPDNMPSMRLYEGDLRILVSLLDKLNDKLTSHGSAIAAIVNDIHDLQSRPVSSVNLAHFNRSTSRQGVINNTGSTHSLHIPANVIPGTQMQGNPDKGNSQNCSDRSKPTGVTQPNWADRVSAVSTPFHSHNQLSALSTETDGDQFVIALIM